MQVVKKGMVIFMKKLSVFCKYLFLTVASFISVFPFYWMIVGATNTSKDITQGRMSFGSNLLINIESLMKEVNILQALWNSIVIAVLTTFFALIISSMAGYAFHIFQTKTINRIFGVMILSMMIPFAAIMIPLFRMMSKWGLLNTRISVILPSISTAFLIFFFRQNTMSFPKELIQAARVDGVREFGIFFRIFMPSMKSTYAAAGIITFMAAWNNYLWPLIALQTNDKKTLPLIISYLSSAYQPDFGVIMVAIVIATLPMLIVFLIMQKYFVEGMIGSIK